MVWSSTANSSHASPRPTTKPSSVSLRRIVRETRTSDVDALRELHAAIAAPWPSRPARADPPPGRDRARPRSAGQAGQEGCRLLAPRVEQPAEERRPAVQLAGQVEVEVEVDLTDRDAPVRIAEPVGPLVDLADEVQLLLQREVPGQLVPPVRDVAHTPRLRGPAARVDPDHPDLLRAGVGQLADRRVLAGQPVPVVPALLLDGAEEQRDGGRGQHGVHGDLPAPAGEGLEVAGEDVGGADEQ